MGAHYPLPIFIDVVREPAAMDDNRIPGYDEQSMENQGCVCF